MLDINIEENLISGLMFRILSSRRVKLSYILYKNTGIYICPMETNAIYGIDGIFPDKFLIFEYI